MNKFLTIIIVLSLKLTRMLTPKSKVVAVIAPSPPGSLGDEALFRGMANLISVKKMTFDEVLLHPNPTPHKTVEGFNKAISFKYSGQLSLFVLMIKLIRHNSLYIIGADCLDGRYSVHMNKVWLAIANMSTSINLPTSIVSFSFSETPNREIVEEIKKSNSKIRYTARDYHSQQRFIKFTNKKCLLVSDLAFSMPPLVKSENALKTLAWIEEKKVAERSIFMGLNINTLPLSGTEENIADNYAQALNQLLSINPKLYIVGLPHDFRKGQSDYDVLALTKEKLKYKDRFEILDQPFSARDIKGVSGKMDFVITGRMHLAIASLSQEVPVYCVVYMNKFEGLMKHFNLTNNLAQLAIVDDISELFEFMNYAINDYQAQLQHIKKHVEKVKTTSSLNFSS